MRCDYRRGTMHVHSVHIRWSTPATPVSVCGNLHASCMQTAPSKLTNYFSHGILFENTEVFYGQTHYFMAVEG